MKKQYTLPQTEVQIISVSQLMIVSVPTIEKGTYVPVDTEHGIYL